ncbi:phosphoglycerate mutase-like protein [Xylariaceae sp. FL0016]|nr:phosphoglycerate mutase-like protein [Xylariaceae sp. FL0016]
MSLQTIHVVRHGFRSPWTVDPATGNYSASFRSPTGLPTDPALTSHGVEQANELADHLHTTEPPIDQVYSSPYYRCLQTIQPFVSQCNSAPAGAGATFRTRVEKGLSEWYGLAHFDHPTSAPLGELQKHFSHIDANYASILTPPRKGETITQLHDRVAACVQAIVTHSDQEGKKSVLICSHAAVVIAIGRVLTGEVPTDATTDDFGAFTCGLSIYRRQGVGQNKATTPSRDRMAPFRGNMHDKAAQNLMHDGRTRSDEQTNTLHPVDRHPLESWVPGPSNSWKCGVEAYGGWTCEANSDCSFLRCGEERGWRFSGDESFIGFDQGSLLSSDRSPGYGALDSGIAPTNDSSSTTIKGPSKL